MVSNMYTFGNKVRTSIAQEAIIIDVLYDNLLLQNKYIVEYDDGETEVVSHYFLELWNND